MKAKKLFAMLLSLCMLLTLVPAIAVSADTACPQMPLGAPNFALGATATYGNNGSNVYDATNGYVMLKSSNWSTPSFDLTLPEGINADDEFVISFYLKRPHSWGQTYQYELTFGTDGTQSQKVSFTINGTTYTAADGTATTLAAASSNGVFSSTGAKIEIHCAPDGNGTRTINIYGGGTLLTSQTNQAILPIDFNVVGRSATNTSYGQETMGLRIYKVDANATAFEPAATAAAVQPAKANPTNLVADNAIAQAVNTAPTNYSANTFIDLSSVLTTADSYVLSAYVQAAAAQWGQATLFVGGLTDNVPDGIQVVLRNPADNSGKANLVYNGSSGYGQYQFYVDNASAKTVGGQYYKVDVFVTPSATEGSVDLYLYIDGVLITKYLWADQTGANGGKMTYAAFAPQVGVRGRVAGLYVYKTSGTAYEAVNYAPSNYVDETAPTVLGVTEGATYSADRYITVTDVNEYGVDNLASVTINGETVESIGNSTYLLPTGQAAGDYVIVATDKAGNTKEINVKSDAVVYYNVEIKWADISYILDGIAEGSGETYSGAKTFKAAAGSEVTITTVSTDSKYGTVKNAGWGWLANKAYTFTVTGDIGFVLQSASKPTGTLAIEGEGTVEGFPTTGYVDIYHKYNVVATPAEGWEFSHFEWNGVEHTENPLELDTATSAVELKAVFVEKVETVDITISYADIGYYLEGILDYEGEIFTGKHTFQAVAGSTVKIVTVPTETHYGTVKNASWGWLSNNAYTVENVTEPITFVIQKAGKPTATLNVVGEGTVEGFPTTGYASIHTKYTVTATPAEGWEFSHFVWGGTEQTKNPLEIVTGTAAVELTAVFVEIPTETLYTVTIPEAVGGTATGAATDLAYGATVTLTATADEGYEFAYWMIGTRTYADAELVWTVNADVTATPVFRAVDAESYTVIFRSADGRVIATLTSTEIEEGAELPQVPARYGYTDGAWDFEPADGITADMSVYPTYTKAATTYTITAVGGVASKEAAEYETRVKVTATINGFTAWVDENGTVLSTDKEYTFFVTRNITVTATADAAADYSVTINPTSLNTDNGSTYTMTLVGETMIGEGYRLIECGFVYTTKALDETTLKIGNAGVKKAVSSKREAGQYAYNLSGAPKTATITARAYMVIEKDGVQTTVYSGLCDASWN